MSRVCVGRLGAHSGGELKTIAAVLERPVIAMTLTHVGLRTGAPPRAAASRAGGHATRHHCADISTGTFSPLAAPLTSIPREIKQTFDLAGIFNPGRLHPEV